MECKQGPSYTKHDQSMTFHSLTLCIFGQHSWMKGTRNQSHNIFQAKVESDNSGQVYIFLKPTCAM